MLQRSLSRRDLLSLSAAAAADDMIRSFFSTVRALFRFVHVGDERERERERERRERANTPNRVRSELG